MTSVARVHQLSVSDGGVPKLPVDRAFITKDGLDGDRQRNRRVHGGPARALCLFSLELIEALRAEGHAIQPGSTGENETISGMAWTDVVPGSRLRIGSVRLEITGYTAPCEHNARCV